MIKITEMNGRETYLNCDLIERIETVPDTLITLSNGRNYRARETPELVIERIIKYKQRCFPVIEHSSKLPFEKTENDDTLVEATNQGSSDTG